MAGTTVKYLISHTTRYDYEQPVGSCYNLAYMLPRDTAQQKLKQVDIQVQPSIAMSNRRSDYFGNQVFQFSIEQDHTQLSVTVTSEVEIDKVQSQSGFWQHLRLRPRAAARK
jgi:transglutaminase-like putative cysteine protease